MNSNKITTRLLRDLKETAKDSQGVGWGYKLAACVLDKRGRAVSMRANTYKTHPIAARYNGWGHLHAEIHAAIAGGLDDYDGYSLIVIRVHKDGSLACSRPCDDCRRFMEDVGFESVVYCDEEGELIEETIN